MVHPRYVRAWSIETVRQVERIVGNRFLPLLRQFWGEDWSEDEREDLILETWLGDFLDFIIENLPEVYTTYYDAEGEVYIVWLIEYPYDQNDIKWWKDNA